MILSNIRIGENMTTRNEIEQELKGRKVIWVRIFRGGSAPHAHSGMLYGVEGEFGIVKPSRRHREVEHIALAYLSPWRSRNQQSDSLRAARFSPPKQMF